MVNPDDIRAAATLINQLLYAKGYFADETQTEGTEKEEDDNSSKEEKLLYYSIDANELEEKTERIIENDKLNINVIYKLVSDLDKAREDIRIKTEQLKEKDNIIQRKDRYIDKLNNQLILKVTELKEANQKDIATAQKSKLALNENKKLRKDLQDCQNVNAAITAKKDLEIRKHQIQIDSLQDTIQSIHKRQKRISNTRITNSGITVSNLAISPSANPNTSLINTELFDEETSKLITTLTQLTKRSLSETKEVTKEMETIREYLHVLLTEKTPPTPKFFFQNYESSTSLDNNNNNDLGLEIFKLSQLKESSMEELISILSQIHRFFQDATFNNALGHGVSRDVDNGHNEENKKIEELNKQVEKLTGNLNSLYDVNEKLKTRLAGFSNDIGTV